MSFIMPISYIKEIKLKDHISDAINKLSKDDLKRIFDEQNKRIEKIFNELKLKGVTDVCSSTRACNH